MLPFNLLVRRLKPQIVTDIAWDSAKGASGLDYLMMFNHHELPAHELLAELRTLPEVSFVTVLDPAESGAMEPLTAFD